MPELPEVRTISNDLNKFVTGTKIINVGIANNYDVLPSNETFKASVRGQIITGVSTIAKNILLELENGYFIAIHLAMTGRLLLRDEDHPPDRWTKVVLKLSNGTNRSLRFTDMRMFGKVELLEKENLYRLKAKYGPEIIDTNLNAEDFFKIIKSKKTNIKNILMDQSFVSGLGNIYATDALFMAKIHPETHTDTINFEMAENLLEKCKEIVNEGIINRGSTLPDKMYVDIFGKEGKQQNNFKVYMRNFCIKCGTKVDTIKLNGRGTYFCPNCQTLPKETQEKNVKGLF